MNCVHKVNHFPTCNDITVHFFQCLITLLITSVYSGHTCIFTPMQIWPFLNNTVEQKSYSELSRLQAGLQQYVNWEIPDVQTGLRKSRGIKSSSCQHSMDHKVREFQKNIYFCFTDYTKAFNCVDHNELWKIFKELRVPDHLTCLLRKLHAGQEATVKTRHRTMDWFKIGKGVHQGCILSPCLL